MTFACMQHCRVQKNKEEGNKLAAGTCMMVVNIKHLIISIVSIPSVPHLGSIELKVQART